MNGKLPIIIVLFISIIGTIFYYRSLYHHAEKARRIAVSDFEKQQVAVEQLSQQIHAVSALDAKHTRELEHDKNLIAQLERDVAANRRRLHVKATCSGMPAHSPAARMDDAASARLDDTAQRNYFTLRHRIEIAEQQINGLQDYIRQVVFARGSPYQQSKETKK